MSTRAVIPFPVASGHERVTAAYGRSLATLEALLGELEADQSPPFSGRIVGQAAS